MKRNGRHAVSGDPTPLQVLRQAAQDRDAGVWNRWRDEHHVERPELRGADLSGLVLHDVNLQFADLTGARLVQATITASLDHAVLVGADLTGAQLWSCRFEETRLVDSTCQGTQFRASRIVASNFSGAKLQKANFERCYLEDTFFDRADLTGATFYQADLWMAFLRGAMLDQVNLRGANLHGAKLAGASRNNGCSHLSLGSWARPPLLGYFRMITACGGPSIRRSPPDLFSRT